MKKFLLILCLSFTTRATKDRIFIQNPDLDLRICPEKNCSSENYLFYTHGLQDHLCREHGLCVNLRKNRKNQVELIIERKGYQCRFCGICLLNMIQQKEHICISTSSHY